MPVASSEQGGGGGAQQTLWFSEHLGPQSVKPLLLTKFMIPGSWVQVLLRAFSSAGSLLPTHPLPACDLCQIIE